MEETGEGTKRGVNEGDAGFDEGIVDDNLRLADLKSSNMSLECV